MEVSSDVTPDRQARVQVSTSTCLSLPECMQDRRCSFVVLSVSVRWRDSSSYRRRHVSLIASENEEGSEDEEDEDTQKKVRSCGQSPSLRVTRRLSSVSRKRLFLSK